MTHVQDRIQTHTNAFRRNTFRAGAVAGLLAVSGLGLAGWGLAGERSEGVAATGIVSTSDAKAATWKLDRVHSSVWFKIRHMGVSNFYGRFNAIDGNVTLDPEDPTTGSMTFTVQVDSVDTGNTTRDGHLQGPGFFNTRQYGEATFTSTSIKKMLDDRYQVTGTFSLNGVEKEITAELYDVRTGQGRDGALLGFEARFDIDRTDFGITKHASPDGSENGPLGNTVTITFAFEGSEG